MRGKVKFLCFLLVMTVAASMFHPVAAETEQKKEDVDQRLKGAIVMHENCSIAYVNGTRVKISSSDSQVMPFSRNGVLFIPTAFVTNSLGFQSKWNAESKNLTVNTGKHSVFITCKNDIMKAGKSSYKLAAPPQLINGYMYVPAQEFIKALGKKLFLFEGLIVISNMEGIFDASTEKQMIYEAVSKLNILPKVGNFDNLMGLFREQLKREEAIIYDKGVICCDDSKEAEMGDDGGAMAADEAPPENMEADTDYSTTNIQVKGVDEADVVKTDGNYIYQVKGHKVIITKAYPAKDMRVLSTLNFDNKNFVPDELYIYGNKMIVTGTYRFYDPIYYDEEYTGQLYEKIRYNNSSRVRIIIYDITDRTKVRQLREVEVDGEYLSSRRIGQQLYIMSNMRFYLYSNSKDTDLIKPAYRDTAIKDEDIIIDYPSIEFFPGELRREYLIVTGINLDNTNEGAKVSAFLGCGDDAYVSSGNMYISMTGYKSFKNSDSTYTYDSCTFIYRFGLNDGKAVYTGKGEVPGYALNQFSMDEHDRYFRIATTSGYMWWGDDNTLRNNLYVLDDMMNICGRLENIAPEEKIYSARFMGDRCYMVTFKTIDPLFVIDMKSPSKPKVLGELKIPGYSDYLHPYDENHVIGFGKDAVEVSFKDNNGKEYNKRAFSLGMKIALFDVRDVSRPVQKFYKVIGDRGTYSELLYNHKALLFSRQKNVLAFPVTVMTVKNKKPIGDNQSPEYGTFEFQGAYVYSLDLKNGFKLKGRITHLFKEDYKTADDEYGYQGSRNIKRILFVKDTLYTLSDEKIKANNIDTLKEINTIDIQ